MDLDAEGIRFGSICSGIESASVAWEPLGLTATWFAEIEPFPSAVLDHHWPHIENLGDMCDLPGMVSRGAIEAPDILVGGTPCQSFSVAGKRTGIVDERGQLTLKFVELADEIDKRRAGEECIVVWENVPGVLSSKDNAFGCFLGELAGEDCELKPAGKKWTNAGCVFGPKRAIAWRILDAQYFGVAQRRRRVFVVASARDGFDPCKVLFESEGLRRDIKPSREAKQEIAKYSQGSTGEGGISRTLAIDTRQDPQVYEDVAGPCTASFPPNGVLTKKGSHWDSSENPHPPLTQSFNTGSIGYSDQEVFGQRGAGIVPFDMTAFGQYGDGSTASTCKARDYKDATDLVIYPINDKATRHKGATGKGSGNGLGIGSENDPMFTLTTVDKHAVSFAENVRSEVRESAAINALTSGGGKPGQGYAAIREGMVVRRLMPVECERLQGFNDNHTQIPWRGKDKEDCPDGQRFKVIGNSKAVPVVQWIGLRLIKELSECKKTKI